MTLEKRINFKSLNEEFKSYIDEATKECQKLSFTEKTQGMWGKSEILKYLAKLPIDEPIKYLNESLEDVLPNIEKKKILCIGGGVGRLGKYIAEKNSNSSVLEVDTSIQMVNEANKLAQENGENNFISIVADARNLPFKEREYDYVFANRLLRYIDEKDRKIVVSEMLRVSKYGATISEGKAKDIMYSIRDLINPKLFIKKTKMPMFRMSLFYMLLRKYENDQLFRTLVDKKSNDTSIEVLSKLAGISDGIFYELRLKSS